MNALVPIALFGFIPISMLLFTVMSVQRALAAIYVLGWLFLPPNISYNLPGIPAWDKYNALAVAAVLGAVLFDAKRVFGFRPKWYDLPAAFFCLVPLGSSLTNGLGAYDGLSASLTFIFQWGVPYFVARIFFSSLQGVRDLALWIVIGTIIYVPLCLWEIRFSPQLNRDIYGYYQNPFNQTRRWGGFRPMVFMNTGLAVGLWMSGGALLAFMCWLGGWPRRLMYLPMPAWAFILSVVSVLCKSMGAVVLMAGAMVVGLISKRVRTRVLVALLAFVPLVYIGTRSTGVWDGEQIIRLAEAINPARANSLEVRIRNETVTVAKGLEKPIFGWGGHGRNRVSLEESGFRSIVDGLWVIMLSQRGLVGLVCMLFILIAPVVLFLQRWKKLGVSHPWLILGTGMCLVLSMFAMDSLLNAMLNPIYVMASGAIMGLTADKKTMDAILASAPRRVLMQGTIADRAAATPRVSPAM